MFRDAESHKPVKYYSKMPDDIADCNNKSRQEKQDTPKNSSPETILEIGKLRLISELS